MQSERHGAGVLGERCGNEGCSGYLRHEVTSEGRLRVRCDDCEDRVRLVAMLTKSCVSVYERTRARHQRQQAEIAVITKSLRGVADTRDMARSSPPSTPSTSSSKPASSASGTVASTTREVLGTQRQFPAKQCAGSCGHWFYPQGPNSKWCPPCQVATPTARPRGRSAVCLP